MKRKILYSLILLLTPLMVHAETFKNGDNTYAINSIEVKCNEDIVMSTILNNNLIFEGKNSLTKYKLNENNECIKLTTQEILDIEHAGMTYYEIFKENNEYYIEKTNEYWLYSKFIKTTDTEINSEKTYFTLDENGPVEVTSPEKSMLAEYYEEAVFIAPLSAEIDESITYYIEDGLTVKKVENPTEEDFFNYIIKAPEDYGHKREKIFKITNTNLISELQTKEYSRIVYDETNNEAYILIFNDPNTDYISVYKQDGTKLELPEKTVEYALISDSLYIVITEESTNTYKSSIYNNDNKLLLTNEKDILLLGLKINENKNLLLGLNQDISEDVIYELIEYKVISGNNQTYKGKDLELKSSGELSKLDKVLVNDKELNKDDYTLKEGSTIITLKKEYLSTLEKGEYTLTITYTDGGEVTSTFNISDKLINNPQTLDNITTSIIIALVSIIGLVISTIYLKKQIKN